MKRQQDNTAGRAGLVGRVVIALTLCLSALAGSAGTAWAHYVYNIDHPWSGGNSGECVKARSEISHGDNDGGYSAADSWTFKEVFNGPNCTQGWNRPPGYLSAKAELYSQNNNGNWVFCAATPFVYNTNDSWHITKTKYWSRPCGHTYYYTNAGAFTYYNNAWRGGYLWSSSHWL